MTVLRPWRLAAALGLASVVLAAWPILTPARPFGVEDLLALESLGPVALDPAGRWLVIERRDAYASAPRFDLDDANTIGLTRILVTDLAAPAAPRALLPGRGYVMGPFSPDGRRLVVFRLQDRRWDLGVVTLATGAARWFAVNAEQPVYGPSVIWRGPDELLVVARRDGTLPLRLRLGWEAGARLSTLWARQAAGQVATATAIGAGASGAVTPMAAPDQVLRVDVARGAVRVLADGAAIYDLALSPDGRWLAMGMLGEELEPQAGDILRVGTPSRRRRLLILDLVHDGVSDPCAGCDILSHLLAWSPRSDRLLVYGRRDPQSWTQGRLLAVSPTAAPQIVMAVQPEILETADTAPLVRADWLNCDPLVYGRIAGAARADWYRIHAGRAVALTLGLPTPSPRLAGRRREGLWVDAAGQVLKLGAGPGGARRGRAFAPLVPGVGDRGRWTVPTGAPIRVSATPDGGARVAAWDGVGVTLPAGMEVLGYSSSRRLAVVSARDDHGVERLRLISANGVSMLLLTLNPQLADLDLAKVVRLVHGPGDKRPGADFLYLPPSWRPGDRPPLVVIPYPGSVFAQAPLAQSPGRLIALTNAQVLAGHGYGVLVPSLPAGPDGQPAAGLAANILAAVDGAVDRGFAAGSRVGLWGHSFGGYAALVAATQTDRFRAIVASAGVADLGSFYGASAPFWRVRPEEGLPQSAVAGWLEAGQASLGGPPWRLPGAYVANSPFYAADRIVTPLMMIQGDQDNGGAGQGEAMFAALHRQAKDVVLVTYAGEAHLVQSPANIRDLYQRIFGWFDGRFGSAASLAAEPSARPTHRAGSRRSWPLTPPRPATSS